MNILDKDWWKNYFYYYKYYILGGAVLLIVLLITLANCAMEKKPDMTVGIFGNVVITDETIATLNTEFAKIISDANKDGKINISITNDAIPVQAQTGKNPLTDNTLAQEQAVFAKLLASDENFFIIDKNTFNLYKDSYVFDDVSSILGWATSNKVLTFEGKPRGALVSSNRFMSTYGITAADDELVIAVRTLKDSDKNNTKKKIKYENARKVFEFILNQ